jgi:hypothetical protein
MLENSKSETLCFYMSLTYCIAQGIKRQVKRQFLLQYILKISFTMAYSGKKE